MTVLITLLCLILLVIVIIQIGKVSELAGRIRGEADVQRESNYWNSRLSLIFLIVFLVATFASAYYYKNWMLGYGPHQAASEHGGALDFMFNLTLIFTGIVFVLTQIALFYFAYKYRQRPGHKADFMPHDNKLEMIWTAVPAVVMTILVVFGLNAWNEVMADVSPDEEYIEIEATGMQFAWILRYPGEDGELGSRDFRAITGINPLGQLWEDEANLDDLQPSEIVLPVGKKVRVRINSRDVLHNFYLPHFRVKMDAVPGMPTYFVFTPTKTTEEYRQTLSKYKEYNVPSDPEDPESQMLWETFDYELACAELCGSGHFSMQKKVRIVTEEEYEEWLTQQTPYYESTIKGSDSDPYKTDEVEEIGMIEDESIEDGEQEFEETITE
jgi:cytochrome c oxidase subunit 2